MVVFIRSLLWCALCLSPLLALGQSGGDELGVPWTGGRGVTVTVSDLMTQDKNLPLQSFLKPAQSDEGRLLPNRQTLGHNPGSPRASRWPQRPEASTPAPAINAPAFNAQSVGTSFLAAQLSESGFIPPDSMGAVGPSQVLVCVNGRIKVFDKTGVGGALNTTSQNFFSSQTSSGASDPRVRYDRLSGRWFVVAIDVPHSNKNNKVLVAVSSASVITDSTSFTFFSFTHSSPSGGGDSGLFADYPTLGIDANALYIGADMFSGNAFANTSAYILNKANLLAGTLTVTAFRQLINGSGSGPVTPQGVDNDDPLASHGFLIGVDASLHGLLVIRRISNPGGVPAISGNLNLTVPDTVGPVGGVPAMGSSVSLDALDDRLYVARMHNGSLWTAHNLEVDATGTADVLGGRKGSRWYEITNLTATPGLRQAGTLFDPASNPANYWIPSCTMNGQGHMVLGCSVAGVNQHAEIAVAGRFATDPLGTLQSPTVVQTSGSTYNVSDNVNPHRWGDYSLTTVDPNDDMTFWTVQEYCNANNSWGVRVIQIKAPPPATPLSCNPSAVPAGATNLNVVVTGFLTNGSGFFDPGPGFPNHLSAAVNAGGVTVNNLTYTDPSHLTLNITVSAGALTGARNVTVTNPDGQAAASASGILTIIGGGTNHPPSISSIPAQTLNEDTALPALAFQVGDQETPAGSLILSASSSNTNLVPIANITFGGSGSNRTVSLLPATNQNGSTTLMLTVADAEGSSTTATFLLTVSPVNDAPSFNPGADQIVLEDAGPQTILNWATAISAGPANESTQALQFLVSNDNNSLFSVQPVIAPDGALTYTTASNANGTATLTVRLQDDGGTTSGGMDASPPQNFSVAALPVNDPPVLAPLASQTLHQGATLILTNISTDPDFPPNLLTYSLSNAPAGAAINSSSGVFTWTPSSEQVNTTNIITVTVADDGVPVLRDAKTFTVIVLPPPLLTSIVLSNTVITLKWKAIIGTTYRIQAQTDLNDTSMWEDLPGDVTATELVASKVDDSALAPQRFYRIILPP